MISIQFSALKQTSWHEYAIRFLLGGVATAITGLIGRQFGPATAGLFLAFPAVFCASATLIEKHEREREAPKGSGVRRGQLAAAVDAAGASLGSLGLLAFAAVVWQMASRGWIVMPVALIAWAVVSFALWVLWRRARDRL
jgi:hypothetical protein